VSPQATASMRLRPNVALQQTGRLVMERAPRALLLIALQLNSGVIRQQTSRDISDRSVYTVGYAADLALIGALAARHP
jgi:hypothetical protein